MIHSTAPCFRRYKLLNSCKKHNSSANDHSSALSAKNVNNLSRIWDRSYVQKSRSYSETMFLPLAPNILVTPCKESRCCYVPSLQICEMPRFESGFLLLQGKNTKGKKTTKTPRNRMGEKHKLLFDI